MSAGFLTSLNVHENSTPLLRILEIRSSVEDSYYSLEFLGSLRMPEDSLKVYSRIQESS